MRRGPGAWLWALSLLLLTPSACRATPSHDAAADRHVAILCYHDISTDTSRDSKYAPLTISPDALRQQIRECRAAGWTFISLDQLLEHRLHPGRLPQRALVMTFDDGYRSFRDLALPILRAERVPATVAVITGFVDAAPAGMAPLMSWDELNEIATDSLVTLVSHTHGLHRYTTCNPYRDTQPSVASRRYLLAEARYENREEYRHRVRADMDSARSVFAERLRTTPNVLVWPYGVHNDMARGQAAQAGFAITLALGGREVTTQDLRAGCLPRIMVNRKLRFDRGDAAWLAFAAPPVRAASVDLDDVYSRDPREFDTRVNQLVARVRGLGINNVFLSVCSDSAAPGTFVASFVTNHQVHVRADVWSMVASRLSQANVDVWARVPAMNLSWTWQQHPEWRIGAATSSPAGAERGSTELVTQWPNRLSPDVPEARRAAIDFLTDLAVYAPLDGVVFDDDAAMAPNERLALAGAAVPRDKAVAIDDLLSRCREAVRAWRPDCSFARVVDAEVLAKPGLDAGHAQDFSRIAGEYDLSVVSTGFDSRSTEHASARRIERLGRRAIDGWRASASGRLATRAAARARRGDRAATPLIAPVLLELDIHDAASTRWLTAQALRERTAAVIRSGVVNVGLTPLGATGGDLPAGLLDPKTTPDLATEEHSER